VRALIGDFGSTQNPIDVTGMGVRADGLAGLLEIVLSEPDYDSVIVVTPLASSRLIKADAERLSQAIAQHGKPVLFYTYSPPHQESIDLLQQLGIPWYGSPVRAAQALAALVTYTQRERFSGDISLDDERAPSATGLLSRFPSGAVPEYATKAFLSTRGLSITREILAHGAEAAVEAANGIGYPVALKLQSAQLPHKSDVGGVILGIGDDDALRSAFASLSVIGNALRTINVDGILVQEMITGGIEVIIGSIIDPDFGSMIMVGTGGIYAEILNDRVFAPTPLSPSEATQLLTNLKGFPLLQGQRGEPPGDIESLAELVSIVSHLVHRHQDEIEELEINPVLVRPYGLGAIVVDALMTLRTGGS
jgi:acyl-CoA synthetase (NDP forming)